MRRRLALVAFVAILASPALAQAKKGMRFWNLTANTVTSFKLAPAGTDQWGADQAKNDKDGTVDHDERLKIVGVKPGRYDAQFTDDKGRACTVRNIEVQDGKVFSIEEKDLKDCKK